MSLQKLQELLTQLGQSIGLSNLKADDEGYCCLSFDSKINVHIQLNQRTDNLTFFVELGTVNDSDKDATYGKLLQANVFWLGTEGATLGFNPKNNMVTMGIQRPMRTISFENFQKSMQDFVDCCEKWINQLIDIKNGTPTTPIKNKSMETDNFEEPMPQTEFYNAEDYQADINMIPV